MPTDQARTTINQTRVTGMMNPMTTKVEETKGAALVEQTKEKGKQSLKTFDSLTQAVTGKRKPIMVSRLCS
jgi:hypothetical protein